MKKLLRTYTPHTQAYISKALGNELIIIILALLSLVARSAYGQ